MTPVAVAAHQRFRRRAFLALKLAFGIALVWMLLTRMDLAAVAESFGRYSMLPIIVAVALTFTGTIVAGLRWRLLVPEIPFSALLRYTLIGQFYSVVLPGQVAGEAIKAWKISRGALDGPRLVASVMVDRLVGMIGLMVVAIAGFVMSEETQGLDLLPAVMAGALLLVAALFALAIPAVQNLASTAARLVGSRWPGVGHRLSDKILSFIQAWGGFARTPGRLALSLCLGLFFQILGVGIYIVLARDVGIDISTADWMWMAGVTAIVVLLPLSIGGVGLREGALVVMLAQFGVPGESALVLSLGAFGLSLLPALAGGLVDLADPGR